MELNDRWRPPSIEPVKDDARPPLAAPGSRAFRAPEQRNLLPFRSAFRISARRCSPETGHSRTEKATLNSFAISLFAKDALLEVRKKKAAEVVAVARAKPRGIPKNPH